MAGRRPKRVHVAGARLLLSYQDSSMLMTAPQRPAWVPYFEGSDAIIFLAPISAFDQYLPEDPTRNRIEDSLRLFKWIVSHPLLATAHIILLLNKSDVLKQKLKTGIRVVR